MDIPFLLLEWKIDRTQAPGPSKIMVGKIPMAIAQKCDDNHGTLFKDKVFTSL